MGPMGPRQRSRDLTVTAVPFYFISMAIEHLWLRHRLRRGQPSSGDYERQDTLASLTMGVGSLVVPAFTHAILRPFTPGRGRYGKVVVGTALAAVGLTTVADVKARRAAGSSVEHVGAGPGKLEVTRAAQRIASTCGVAAVAIGGVAITTSWAAYLSPQRLWRRRVLPDLGRGLFATVGAIVAWDFIYYWNHRFMHESRFMWAYHVVHHSSERLNLSTALRQPVAEVLTTPVPYGVLCLFGIDPALVETARGVNLLYQFWIHTEAIGRLGQAEGVLNTPSHHRVHHGSNRQYLDRNHGSILILWDRVFGTFQPEGDRVVYGLTTNIDTFNPVRIASQEYVDILRDVSHSTSWAERLSYVVRSPGWGKERQAEQAAVS
jgi:sterol desaturase/sphingolipid hydroxylase (fatty acid hydroxylase superfamily)